MGFISRKIFPACGSMCVCCPALRSRSRQPVKRYKKLLADIFPKSVDGLPNERKISKLCEYAAKNPVRLPKIARHLEERFRRELRYEHLSYINIVAEIYNKLLCTCKEQVAYFAVSLLNVATELLDYSKQDAMQILGCQMLTRFILSQTDGTYGRNIENLVSKVCMLAHESGEEHQRRCLRASSLQCLSAMVWFMGEFSNIFPDFEEIIQAVLDNYEPETHNGNVDERVEQHHWVDEVVRCEGRGAGIGIETSPICMGVKPRPEKKDPSLLTREEIETPKVWAQICIQRMAELAKESTTMRCILDPMFVYFDLGRHWVPHQGLAPVILSDLSYFMESSGNQHLILASVIRHLDHKNVAHDPQLKSHVIQVATALARQIRTVTVLAEIGFVSDLCRHLRKSLQATVESVGESESEINVILQNSIEECLLEIGKGMRESRPLYDMMALMLERLAPAGVVARATIGSLMILAHVISIASATFHPQQMFPEALLVQLLKAMLHPDVETRVGAHQLFSLLLTSSSYHRRHEVSSQRSSYLHEARKWRSDASSTFASVTALLEKLRKEKDGIKVERNTIYDDSSERDYAEEDCKRGWPHNNSPSLYKISSLIDKTAGSTSLTETEPLTMKFTDDQIMQLLSGFWMQASFPDNLPPNIEAIAHSFSLTLSSLRLKNPNDSLVVRFFQLPLSLRRASLDSSNGSLPPVCQRSILTLTTGMLMFAAKVYQIPKMYDLLKSLWSDRVDPYLVIGDNLQIFIKPQADLKKYGSAVDNQQAHLILNDLLCKVSEMDKVVTDILVQNLSNITELEADVVANQLTEAFMPDESLILGSQSMHGLELNQTASYSKESVSSDGDFHTNSVGDDEVSSEPSVANLSHFIPKVPPSPSISNIIGVGKLLESALEVAGHVAGTSISTSPLPYDTMASQCEALGAGTRKKLSNWLAHEYHSPTATKKPFPISSADSLAAVQKITKGDGSGQGAVKLGDPWMAMKLPPTSPFDNFLRAAGC